MEEILRVHEQGKLRIFFYDKDDSLVYDSVGNAEIKPYAQLAYLRPPYVNDPKSMKTKAAQQIVAFAQDKLGVLKHGDIEHT